MRNKHEIEILYKQISVNADLYRQVMTREFMKAVGTRNFSDIVSQGLAELIAKKVADGVYNPDGGETPL